MSSNPTIETIVSRMQSGAEYRVGQDLYRWDAAHGAIFVEGPDAHVISEGQLRQVVANYPEVFGGAKATLDEVIDRMKGGEQVQYGGGRMFEIFGWDPGTQQLYVESVVDGEVSRGACTAERLAEALAESPQVFADVRYK